MTTDPTAISHEQVVAALETWGIDLDDVMRVRMSLDAHGGSLEIRRTRRDPDGGVLMAGDVRGTVTVLIGIERTNPPVVVSLTTPGGNRP